MLIEIRVRNNRNKKKWPEQYDKPDIHTQEEALEWAKELVAWFNATAPPGGSTRTLLSCQTFPEGTPGDWRKTRR